jgi:hypothetical protein
MEAVSNFFIGQLFTLLDIIGKLSKNSQLFLIFIAEVFHSFHFLAIFFRLLFIHCQVYVKRYL